MSLRNDILDAMGLEDGISLPLGTKLVVGNRLDALKKAAWIQNKKGNGKARLYLDAYLKEQAETSDAKEHVEYKVVTCGTGVASKLASHVRGMSDVKRY